MCDLIYDVISCCICSLNMGEMNVYDKIVIENQEKEKILKSDKLFTNLHLKYGIGMKFIAC